MTLTADEVNEEMNDKQRKFWVRLMAIVMAVLMIAGTAYTALSYLLV